VYVRQEDAFYRGTTGWTAFDFRIHMINDFLKYHIDLGAPFMINTENITEIL
jgi:hypothetical protein